MSLLSRIARVFRADRLTRELDEELQSHLDEAVDQGRDSAEARRALGPALQLREQSSDIRLLPWLDSLRADTIFGLRQLAKRRVISAAAMLSLALAIGACTAAFRLIDALLLRPLPVTGADRLYGVYRAGIGFDGKPQTFDGWAYPSFARMRETVKDEADLLAVSYTVPVDLSYRSDQEMEKANLQYVSGSMFDLFGLRPALGRLPTGRDDGTPGAHPYAVLSYDYWTRRFARDPKVVGRTFHYADQIYEIVGVGPEPFTGTETGIVTDIFLPAMMHPGAIRDDQTWHRTLAILHPGIALEPVRQKLQATCRAFELDRARKFTGMTKQALDQYVDQSVLLESASAGYSGLQQDYRRSLLALGVLVALVLLIACANVANLMTAQAAARAREMALRVSIGAGRGRLMQLVLVEGTILSVLAAIGGAIFASWSAPFVVARIGNHVRLSLPIDWRILGFSLALTLAVTLLFGLSPALRASAIKPVAALKGGEDPHSRRRLMHALIALQVAFCFVVLFASNLFAATFVHLSKRSMGFSAERILTLFTLTARPQLPAAWDEVAEHLRGVPGVEQVALASWPLLTRNSMSNFLSINGAPPSPVLAYFLNVSPGWIETMRIPLLDGRDLRPADISPGSALVNQTFVREFFGGEPAIGKRFLRGRDRYEVVGVVGDAPYRALREPILPVAYVSMHGTQLIGQAAFIIRTTAANPRALASTLRREVAAARSEFRVSTINTQAEIVRSQTLRERLLAMLGLFFAGVAILLAGIGLYGVLDYGVLQRRREIGIRVAIGAEAANIVRLVTFDVVGMIFLGSFVGVGLGVAAGRYLADTLYQVKPTDPAMLAIPWIAIFAAALLAGVPAVIRALRIDPAAMLRSE